MAQAVRKSPKVCLAEGYNAVAESFSFKGKKGCVSLLREIMNVNVLLSQISKKGSGLVFFNINSKTAQCLSVLLKGSICLKCFLIRTQQCHRNL